MVATEKAHGILIIIPTEVKKLILDLWLLVSKAHQLGGSRELREEIQDLRLKIDHHGYWIELHEGSPGDFLPERTFVGKPILH
jgi:hypothetical protein